MAPTELDDDLAEVAQWVHGTHALPDLLDRVATIGLGAVAGADVASVVLVSDAGGTTVGSTDEAARRLDEVQQVTGRGPGVDVAYGGSPAVVADHADDPRWPEYTAAAVELGIRSSVAVPMPVQEHVLGTVTWHAREPDTFTEGVVGVARDYAARVAVLVTNAHLYGSIQRMAGVMQAAMESRAAIEQAKGIIMATRGCDADTAFHTLVRQSQHENRKLRDIALELVDRQGR